MNFLKNWITNTLFIIGGFISLLVIIAASGWTMLGWIGWLLLWEQFGPLAGILGLFSWFAALALLFTTSHEKTKSKST